MATKKSSKSTSATERVPLLKVGEKHAWGDYNVKDGVLLVTPMRSKVFAQASSQSARYLFRVTVGRNDEARLAAMACFDLASPAITHPYKETPATTRFAYYAPLVSVIDNAIICAMKQRS